MNLVTRLALGTVQWGLPYGIANRSGQPDPEQIRQIILKARRSGIGVLDTAFAYGEAESILGSFRTETEGFRIVTKTLPVTGELNAPAIIQSVRDSFLRSLERLKRTQVYGLLVHRGRELLEPAGNRLWEMLSDLKAQGAATRIGVSVYDPGELSAILDQYPIDAVDLPYNIYDQRFSACGLLRQLRESGIEVHARSPFLQGLLLLRPAELPAQFDAVRAHHENLYRRLNEKGLTPLEGALRFALSQPDIEQVVFGCDTLAQLEEILAAACDCAQDVSNLAAFAVENRRITNPSTWT